MIFFEETQNVKYYPVTGELGDYYVEGECFYGSSVTFLDEPELIFTHKVTGEQIHVISRQMGHLIIDPVTGECTFRGVTFNNCKCSPEGHTLEG
jgi:hypothetical protein